MHFLLCRFCNLTKKDYLCTDKIIYFGYIRDILSDSSVSSGTYRGSCKESFDG